MIAELAARILHYRGTKLMSHDRPLQASRRFLASLALAPSTAISWLHLGNCLLAQNDAHGALGCFRRAMALAPNWWKPRNNAGMALLALGQWDEGWDFYESRFAPGGFRAMHALQTRESVTMWKGESPAGKTLYVFNEQGIGDTIMCLRYIEELANQAERVVVRVPGSLARLCRASFRNLENVSVVGDGEPVPEGAVVVPFMSLPHRMGGAPTGDPYLRLYPNEPRFVFTPPLEGLRVGIVWSGQAYPRNRSIPIDQLAALFDLRDVTWVSLQYGEAAKELDRFPQIRRPYLGDFYDTARVMKELDLLITIDSAPAHLAGALGVPVWTLLQFAADWRWGLNTLGTPWYNSMLLFRQTLAVDWSTPLARISRDLVSRLNARSAA